MTVTTQSLSESPLFAGLDEDVRHEILLYVHERKFSSGQVIVLAREPCRAVYLIVHGVVRAYHASLEGREQVLAYLGPGGLFNLVSALDGGSIPANLDALTDVTLYTLPCDRFRMMVRNYQPVATAVLEHLVADARRLSGMVEDLALHTVRTRLARFLLSRAGDRQSPNHWTQEKISLNAAYEDERIVAYLFLPKGGVPPYQTVIYFPSSASFAQRSSRDLDTYMEFDFFLAPLVKSGRAVLYPVYKGTFERGNNELFAIHGGPRTHQYTAFLVKVVKDFRRCIDYLQQERPDIDGQRFAYCGFSTGGSYGTIITAVEDRLDASVLAVGGMAASGRPEVNPINYVGRVRVPTLMLNGKYDLNIPYETNVRPMFDLLGELVNNDNKELKLYETDHFIPRDALVKETQLWLDRYLGPVK